MSSNRILYDSSTYNRSVKQNNNIEQYQMYVGKFDNGQKCRIDFGILAGNDVSTYTGNMVDLESDLRGQTRICSSDNTNYPPMCNNGNSVSYTNKKDLPICSFTSYNPIKTSGLNVITPCSYM